MSIWQEGFEQFGRLAAGGQKKARTFLDEAADVMKKKYADAKTIASESADSVKAGYNGTGAAPAGGAAAGASTQAAPQATAQAKKRFGEGGRITVKKHTGPSFKRPEFNQAQANEDISAFGRGGGWDQNAAEAEARKMNAQMKREKLYSGRVNKKGGFGTKAKNAAGKVAGELSDFGSAVSDVGKHVWDQFSSTKFAGRTLIGGLTGGAVSGITTAVNYGFDGDTNQGPGLVKSVGMGMALGAAHSGSRTIGKGLVKASENHAGLKSFATLTKDATHSYVTTGALAMATGGYAIAGKDAKTRQVN